MLSSSMNVDRSSSDNSSDDPSSYTYSDLSFDEAEARVGAALRAYREQKDMTIPQLVTIARRFGMNRFTESAAQKYERGERAIPFVVILAYSRVLRVPVQFFFDGVR